MKEFTYSKIFFKVLRRKVRWNPREKTGMVIKNCPLNTPQKERATKQTSAVMKFKSLPET